MSSRWIEALRSVALNVPDLAKAEDFYTTVWQLDVVHRKENAVYLRGSGTDHHLLALYAGGEAPQIRQVTLRARSAEALQAIAEAVPRAGGTVLSPIASLSRNPAGGSGLTFRDPHGRIFQVVYGDARHHQVDPPPDRPQRLTHVVLNSHAVDETQKFLSDALDFKLADRTVAIAFMNCNRDHHTLAIGVSDNDALNHIAFLMPNLDSVMRGGGRMKDAGFPIQWGPGRHGPGNNLFNYFIDPFGVVIEYTADVEQIDEAYQSRGPAEWKWPLGRVDQWGISPPPAAILKDAQRRVLFVPT
ncbi:VOC family protein [Variovorax saccharolyticus]|uniref:VOC family protein n=1 Tax=Variovorax saccharolyticus TaxID=3053516 RepID=UPI0025791D4A|nr:VOC family protein [Variovorax sp. J31P216]MDM0028370.1 VOC family protein [Variovorax sp. J31P216]